MRRQTLLLLLLPVLFVCGWYAWREPSIDQGDPTASVDPDGYIETPVPASFKTDGRGSVATKSFYYEERTPLPQRILDALYVHIAVLENNPHDKDALIGAADVLSMARFLPRAVPYLERFVAEGGDINEFGYWYYISGLSMLARFEQAEKLWREAERKFPGSINIAHAGVRLYWCRCHYACRVLKNFHQALVEFAAMSNCCPTAEYSSEEGGAAQGITEFATEAAKNGSLAEALRKADGYWVYLAPDRVQYVLKCAKQAGLAPSPAMLAACDPLNEGHFAPPAALIRRAYPAYEHVGKLTQETAYKLSERAVESAREQKDSRQLLFALSNMAMMADMRGELEAECDAAAEAFQLARSIREAGLISEAKFSVGLSYEKLCDFRRAVSTYNEAAVLAEQPVQYARAAVYKAAAARARSRISAEEAKQVEAELRLAVRQVDERFPGPDQARFVPCLNLGYCLQQQGKHEEAIKQFRRAIERCGPDEVARVNVEIGRCLLNLGRAAEAEKSFEEATRFERKIPSAESRWGYQHGIARVKQVQGDKAGAWESVQEALKTIESQRASLHDFQRRRSQQENKYEVYSLAIELARARNDPPLMFSLAERCRARTFLDALGSKAAVAKQLPLTSLQDVQKACRGFSTVIFLQQENDLIAWIISPERTQMVVLPAPKALQRRLLTRLYGLTGIPGEDAEQAARELYDLLWQPIAGQLKAGERVCIIPHQLLHYVPFQALHDGSQFLISKHELLYSPSGSALVAAAHIDSAQAQELSVHDPILSPDPNSPFHVTETATIQKLFPTAAVFLSEKATLGAFKSSCPKSGILHVSSHGFFDRWIPARSGLIFSKTSSDDGVLRASDVYGMSLDHVGLVVMSACVSSVGEFGEGDEMTGLTRAFQVAGARSVIGSLWPVPNDATTKLMGFFYEEIKKESSDAVKALTSAQRRFLREEADHSIGRWAAFEVTGSCAAR
ncbi:MAG TPA: CHAT domain-containing protein [Planctomycetota bacterium]|jgi:CHAT domain-containing protein/predicted negative regulator of RcsB-dependent stress response